MAFVLVAFLAKTNYPAATVELILAQSVLRSQPVAGCFQGRGAWQRSITEEKQSLTWQAEDSKKSALAVTAS